MERNLNIIMRNASRKATFCSPRDINMTPGGPFSSDPGCGMATLRMQCDDVC